MHGDRHAVTRCAQWARNELCKKKVVQTTELDAPQKSESKLATRLLLAPCAPHLSRSQPLMADPTDREAGSKQRSRQRDNVQQAVQKEGVSKHRAGCAAKIKSKLATRLLLAPCAPRLSRSQSLLTDPTDREADCSSQPHPAACGTQHSDRQHPLFATPGLPPRTVRRVPTT